MARLLRVRPRRLFRRRFGLLFLGQRLGRPDRKALGDDFLAEAFLPLRIGYRQQGASVTRGNLSHSDSRLNAFRQVEQSNQVRYRGTVKSQAAGEVFMGDLPAR